MINAEEAVRIYDSSKKVRDTRCLLDMILDELDRKIRECAEDGMRFYIIDKDYADTDRVSELIYKSNEGVTIHDDKNGGDVVLHPDISLLRKNLFEALESFGYDAVSSDLTRIYVTW